MLAAELEVDDDELRAGVSCKADDGVPARMDGGAEVDDEDGRGVRRTEREEGGAAAAADLSGVGGNEEGSARRMVQ